MGVLNLFKGMGKAEKAGQAIEKAGRGAQRTEQAVQEAGRAGRVAGEAGKVAEQGGRAAEHSRALDWMERDAKVKVNPESGAQSTSRGTSRIATQGNGPTPPNGPNGPNGPKGPKGGEADVADEAKEAVVKKQGRGRNLGKKAWKTIKAHPVGTIGGGAAALSAVNPDIGSFLTEKSAEGVGNIVKGVTSGLTKAGKNQSSILQAVMTPAGAVAGVGLAGKVLGIGKGGILDTIENVALLGGGAGMAYNYYTSKTSKDNLKEDKSVGKNTGTETQAESPSASQSQMRTPVVNPVTPTTVGDDQPDL